MMSPMDGPCLFALSTCCLTLSIPGSAGRAVVDEPASKQISRTSGRLESSMVDVGMVQRQFN
uniref:Secreted protein n=1 Tax=Triticum urartu TaxID=4572 RepID=A0A8R7V0U9_TRIUA